MVIETALEWHRFTCLRCTAEWITRYTVRHVINVTGVSRSFYTHGGVPCAHPAATAAEAVCPSCRRSTVRAKLIRHTVVEAVHQPVPGGDPHGPHEPAVPGESGQRVPTPRQPTARSEHRG